MVLADAEYFFVRNHSSSTILKTKEPWLEGDPDAPTHRSTRAYSQWLKDDSTDHCCVSLVASSPWNLRVNNENAPEMLYGIIADYDSSWDKKKDGCPEFHIKPNWSHSTKRGRVHFIWVFEEPIPLSGSFELYEKYVKEFISILNLEGAKTMLDTKALLNPRTYYDVGADEEWTLWNRKPVDRDEILALREKVVTKEHNFRDIGQEIPLEEVAECLSQKYPDPGFSWSEFKEGFRCHRFWDPNADAQSCVVWNTGISSHTETTTNSFMHWSHEDLCGFKWVAKFSRVQKTKVVQCFAVLPGGKKFFEFSENRWKLRNIDQVRAKLAIDFNVSSAIPRKAISSPMTEALKAITDTREFAGLSTFIFNDNPVVEYEGGKYLNAYVNRLLKPAHKAGDWGDNFPELARHLSGFFTDSTNLLTFLSWWSHLLKYAHAPKSAEFKFAKQFLGVIIAGEVGAGKNMLSKMVQLSLGGAFPADKFVTGEEPYNSGLIDSPLWRIDDPDLGRAYGVYDSPRKRFEKMLKKLLANDYIMRREMYITPSQAPMQSAIIITTNLDAESLEAMPIPSSSFTDKLAILKAQRSYFYEKGEYPGDEELVKGELPHLIAFLLEMEIPEEFKNERFGINPHYDLGVKVEMSDIDPATSRFEVIEELIASMGGSYTGTSMNLFIEADDSDIGILFSKTYKSLTMFRKDLKKIENGDSDRLVAVRKRTKKRRWMEIKLVDEESE